MAFHDKVAREVMVPRTDAFMIDIEDDLEENLDDILRQPYSRIPVYPPGQGPDRGCHPHPYHS